MIEFMDESTGRFVGIRAGGKLTDADYRDVLIPRLENLFDAYGTLCVLIRFDEDFAGLEIGAAWDDARFGMRHRADFEKLAVVGGPDWIGSGLKAFSFLMKGEIRTYPTERLEEAWEWIAG